MADPISLAAIAGLIFAGRSMSRKSKPELEPVQQTMPQEPQITYENDFPEFTEREI
jgi:hypothetical protein